MNNKQKYIYNKICKKNNLPVKNSFVQHRNLKEFSSFYIERINPTHIIYLYGKLKKKYIHDGHYNKVIKVGEILLSLGFALNINNYLFGITINIITGSILLSLLLEYIIEGESYFNRDRRRYRFGKNDICSTMCID